MKNYEIVDYRKFRFSKLNSPEFKHLWYLLYWPIFGILFLTVERLWIRESYFPMYCPLDDMIPFCEYFLIPYMFWFVYLVGIILYSLLFDTRCFEQFMQFIIITYTIAVVICMIFPNCQELRPVAFERDNIFTRFMTNFYQFDTNTNVFPSIHVIGSAAVMFAAWNSKHFRTVGWKIAFGAVALLISISTVFLKQHSVLDIFGALPICLIAYIIVYRKGKRQKAK